MNAQVIDYTIDPTFNSELLFNRDAVSDILRTESGGYMAMGDFVGFESPIFNSALISKTGTLLNASNFSGAKVKNYRGDFLQYGYALNRFSVLGGGLHDLFKFEFKKQAYNGPLNNVAMDAMVMADDHILVAGRFFTDSTLMGTSIASQGLRQLCMIDSAGLRLQIFTCSGASGLRILKFIP